MVSQNYNGQEYKQWLSDLKTKIRNSHLRSALKVNAEMLSLYWELGQAIAEKTEKANWGDKIITQLSIDLIAEFEDIKGFSPSNLKYIRRWYKFYTMIGQQTVDLLGNAFAEAENLIGQQPVDQFKDTNQFPSVLGLIPWGHHIQIFTKSDSVHEALFYIQQTVAHNWKRTVLIYHIDTGFYKTKGKAITNFEMTLPVAQSELASELLKNPYNFGFLNLKEEVKERELENAILSNLEKFLLELGAGFTLAGRQYHLKVGSKDFYIDLLFYHTNLNCYVVVELKVKEFKPEYAGKIEFYITAIDEQIKKAQQNPTIGLLICKTADQIIVEYSLKNKKKPIGVATYLNTIPKELKNYFPDIESLKNELEREIVIPLNPIDEKIKKLKGFVLNMGKEDKLIENSNKMMKQIFNKVAIPLRISIDKKLGEVKGLFKKTKTSFIINTSTLNDDDYKIDIDSLLESERNLWQIGFEFSLLGLINAGAKAFDDSYKFGIKFEKYKYSIGQEKNNIWDERAYSKIHTKEELEIFADDFVGMIIDNIMLKVESIANKRV